jgi:hypothetical protein
VALTSITEKACIDSFSRLTGQPWGLDWMFVRAIGATNSLEAIQALRVLLESQSTEATGAAKSVLSNLKSSGATSEIRSQAEKLLAVRQ